MAAADVTQVAPANVNVSIRIGSPGNDGPVIQINGAAAQGSAQPVAGTPGAPGGPAVGAAPGAAAPPADWNWTWTSACFGGSGGERTLAAWNWTWSCGELPAPTVDALAPAAVDALPPPAAGAPSSDAVVRPQRAPRRPRTRAHQRARVHHAARPTPAATPTPSLALPAAAVAPVVPAVVQASRRHRASTKARARPGRLHIGSSGVLTSIPNGIGPAASSAAGIGFAGALLLTLWIAILDAGTVLAIPHLRRRLRPGPGRWRTKSRATRLERPG